MAGETENKKILVADDDEQFSMMLKNAFEQSGFEVTRALDGEMALSRARFEKPDLVLLDIMMPKKLGFEVLEELKKDEATKNIPVITISHLAQPSDREKAISLGAAEHVVKTNFSIGGLIGKVKEHLG
jgi:CheY-like chemotaxis protein